MENLPLNWLTSDPIDYEYKNYILLAYSKTHENYYKDKLLYPSFENVRNNISYVSEFTRNLKLLQDSKQHIVSVDWLNKKLNYETLIKDDSNMDEVVNIANMSLNVFEELALKFKAMYDFIDETIQIFGETMFVFDMLNGYISLTYKGKETYYKYGISQIYTIKDKYKYKDAQFVLSLDTIKPSEFFEGRLTNNVFEVKIHSNYPYEKSIKPVFKRKFMRHILKRD
jgi:hypothetical protein